MGFANLQMGRTASAPLTQRRATPARQPLANLSPKGIGNSGFSGYGMSAGVKVSHPPAVAQGIGIGGGLRGTVRSRGLHGHSSPVQMLINNSCAETWFNSIHG
jgi:E3 ubiquitin-protein ligase CCNP1IP1